MERLSFVGRNVRRIDALEKVTGKDIPDDAKVGLMIRDMYLEGQNHKHILQGLQDTHSTGCPWHFTHHSGRA